MGMTWLDLWKFHGVALLVGCVTDWIIRDPLWLPHPVRLMGTMIARMEQWLRRWTEGAGRKEQSRAGAILTASMCMVWRCIPWAVVHAAELLWPVWAWAALLLAKGFLCSLMLAARGLYTESMKVCRSLEVGRTEEARYNVSIIVGRDTSVLDKGGIARAAVETVAESASDDVTAPFLFIAFLGLAGGTLYRVVNTMNSMVGYKDGRYLYFGHSAARLGGLLNLAPARLTGILMALGAWALPGMDGTHACKVFLRDGKRHASPNSAHGEAACASAFHLCLAGDAWCSGTLYKKSYTGDDYKKTKPSNIRRANHLMSFAEGMMVLGLAVTILFS